MSSYTYFTEDYLCIPFYQYNRERVEKYSDILEVQHETRRLVSLECPLAEWNDAKLQGLCVQNGRVD